MSDKPTEDPKSGKKVIQLKAKHEQSGFSGKIKETSPGIVTMQIPAKGKECGYEKAQNKQEAKFNNRGAENFWNKTRPHIPADVTGHNEKDPGEYPYSTKVKPPECAASYDGHKVAGR